MKRKILTITILVFVFLLNTIISSAYTFNANGAYYQTSQLPIPFYINGNNPPDSVSQLNALLDAIQEWENVTTAKVTWQYMGMTTDPAILYNRNVGIVSFTGLEGNASPYLTTINGQTYITGFTVRVGNEGAGAQYDVLKAIAMHEMGHALGLGHSSDPNAVMYSIMNYLNPPTTLGADDIAGVSFLYPAGHERPIARIVISPDTIISAGLVTLDASSSSDDGTIIEYTFHFGDGSPDSVTTNPVINHTYNFQAGNNPNTCFLWVEVTDNNGITDNSFVSILRIWENTPPSPPAGLIASFGNNQINLSWNASPESDIISYEVGRSSWSGGPYMPIASVAFPDTFFNDSNLNCRHFYYIVFAIDSSQGQSQNSSEVLMNTSIFFPDALNLISAGTDLLCYGDQNAVASVTAQAGFSPYTYLWNDPLSQTTDTAVNLSGGTYFVTVTDNLGCYNTDTIVIAEPDDLILTLTATPDSGSSDGTATVTVSGGTPPYTYLWDDLNNQTTATAIGLPSGIYYVLLTDNNGCTKSDSVYVPNLTNVANKNTDFDCFIYPNPAGKFIIVEIDEMLPPRSTFELTDLFGCIVLICEINSKKTRILPENVRTGIYIYSIRNGNNPMKNGKINIIK